MGKGLYLTSIAGLALAFGLFSYNIKPTEKNAVPERTKPNNLEIKTIDTNGDRIEEMLIEDSGRTFMVGYGKDGKLKIAELYKVTRVGVED